MAEEATAKDRFHSCLPLTLAQECPHPNDWANLKNFSDDRGDPGGATMCGITHREYDQYRKKQGLHTQPVQRCTQEEGEEIYLTSYWEPYCLKLGPGLDLEFFDASVNEGATEAVKILQHAIGVPIDGVWGRSTQITVDYVNRTQAALVDAVKSFTARRDVVYRETAGFKLFGADWERRDKEIGAAALKMAVQEIT